MKYLIVGLTLALFAGVGIAIKCYQCDGVEDCKDKEPENCGFLLTACGNVTGIGEIKRYCMLNTGQGCFTDNLLVGGTKCVCTTDGCNGGVSGIQMNILVLIFSLCSFIFVTIFS